MAYRVYILATYQQTAQHGLLARAPSKGLITMGTMKRKPGGVDAKAGQKRELTVVEHPSVARNEFTAVQMAVLQQLSRGELLPDIARRLQYHLAPHESDRKRRLKKARAKIRHWTGTAKFRDALYELSVIQLDLDTPMILQGVSKKAKAGRVDAAKLALEITGRHAPAAEVSPAQVNINFGEIPRPTENGQGDGHMLELDADEVVEDAEWSED